MDVKTMESVCTNTLLILLFSFTFCMGINDSTSKYLHNLTELTTNVNEPTTDNKYGHNSSNRLTFNNSANISDNCSSILPLTNLGLDLPLRCNVSKTETTQFESNTDLSVQSGKQYTFGKRFISTMDYIENDPLRHMSTMTSLFVTKGKMDLLSLDPCSQYGTCKHVSNLSIPFCRCDDFCTYYNDCCIDADHINQSTVNVNLNFKCSPHTSRKDRIDGIFIIKNCPEMFTSTDIDLKCRSNDVLTVGPWVASENNVVFQNQFCAECNGVTVFQHFSVNFSNVHSKYLAMEVNTTMLHKLVEVLNLYQSNKFKDVHMEFIPPKTVAVRQCMLFNEPKVKNTENCFNYYMNPVVRATIGKRELYMNVFCVPPDYGCSCLGSSDSFGQWYNWFPLSVVFSFTERNLYCNNKVNKLCIETELYTGYRIDKIVHLLHSFALEVKMIKQIQLVLAWSFRRDVETLGIGEYRTYKKNKTHYVTPINMRLKIIKKLNSIEMLKFETKLHNCLWFMRIKSSTSHDFEFSTFKLERLLNENITNGTSLNSTGLSYKEVNVSIKTSFSEQLCDSYSIESELEEKTAAMIVTKVTCWNELDQTLTSQDFRKNIITYTGMAASIIALTVYLTVHRKFGMHKTIPGSNVENLSIALLLSDILFMVGVGANDHYIVCYTVGVVLHYLWLSVFSFKSVALIYMCHNIRQMSANNAHALGIKNKKAYLTVLGLLLPVIFVGPAVILDLVIPGVNLDYSGSICFPTGYPANLIFVSAPIGLSVLINVVSLMCIALVITKQSYETRHIRKSSSFKFVLVFVRISIVTGAFWVTGVLGAVVQTEFMEYLFIITCSIQGLLFAIANLSTRRVSKSIRKSYD